MMKTLLIALMFFATPVFAQVPVVNPTKVTFAHPDFGITTTYRIAIFPVVNGVQGALVNETDLPKASLTSAGNSYTANITTIVNALPNGTYTATIEAVNAAGTAGRSAPATIPFQRLGPPSKPAAPVFQ